MDVGGEEGWRRGVHLCRTFSTLSDPFLPSFLLPPPPLPPHLPFLSFIPSPPIYHFSLTHLTLPSPYTPNSSHLALLSPIHTHPTHMPRTLKRGGAGLDDLFLGHIAPITVRGGMGGAGQAGTPRPTRPPARRPCRGVVRPFTLQEMSHRPDYHWHCRGEGAA